MHDLTTIQIIWNRACQGGGDAPRTGDAALAAMIGFHSIAMNGGVLYAVEFHSPPELAACQDGFRYFGFRAVADLIGTALEALGRGGDPEALEEMLNEAYAAQIPVDDVLDRAFEAHYRSAPEAYAPLTRA